MSCILSSVCRNSVELNFVAKDRVKTQVWRKPVIFFFHELCLYITRFDATGCAIRVCQLLICICALDAISVNSHCQRQHQEMLSATREHHSK